MLLTALIIAPLLARIGAEARLLRTQFGGEYDTYCARTSRLIPWLYYNIPVALFRCKLGADKKGKEARPYSASRADPTGSAGALMGPRILGASAKHSRRRPFSYRAESPN